MIPSTPVFDLTGINNLFFYNIQYGKFNNERMDIIIPTDYVTPTGVVCEFHGGGFYQGTKESLYASASNQQRVKDYLSVGIAYVAIEYDFIELCNEREGYRGPVESAAEAIQFLKLNASELNLDKDKFFMKGGSAGAGLSLLISASPDKADILNANPLKRESTSIRAISVTNPQASYDFLRWQTDVFTNSPGYTIKAEYENIDAAKKGLDRAYSINSWEEFFYPETIAYREELDILQLIEDNGGVEARLNNQRGLNDSVINYSVVDSTHHVRHIEALRLAYISAGTPHDISCPALSYTPSETEFEFIVRTIG